jgi:predicted ATPase
LLAYHCNEAGLNEKAVKYWLAAGRQAWTRSAAAEAVALLRRGLALVPNLPDTDGRRETELDLQIAFGHAMIVFRGWGAPESGEAYARARLLAQTVNRGRAVLSALWGEWRVCLARADLKQARQLADEMAALGEVTGDRPTRVLGDNAAGFVSFYLGEFTTARTRLERALASYDPADRDSYSEVLPNDMRIRLQSHYSYVLTCLGHLDQALLQCNAAVDGARRLHHPLTLALAVGSAVWTGLLVPLDARSLRQEADELLALANEHGLEFHRISTLAQRGWCLAALGHADEGIRLLNAGITGLRETRLMIFRPFYLTLLADARRMAGQFHAALDHLAEARRVVEDTEERCCQAATLRLTGEVLLAIGDSAAAEAHYCEALDIARQQTAKLWELRAAMSLARLLRDQGKHSEARDLLAPVYDWFTEGFGAPVLQEAKALLGELVT